MINHSFYQFLYSRPPGGVTNSRKITTSYQTLQLQHIVHYILRQMFKQGSDFQYSHHVT